MEGNKKLNIKKKNPKWQILNATDIKLIAAVLMVFDHVHQMWAHAGAPQWLTIVGRPVFPMFLFIATESFHYTHSKKIYLKRLLFASWGMTIFTLILQRLVPNDNIVLMNNAFSTFFITGLYMLFWDWFVDGIRNKLPRQIIKSILFGFIPILSAIPLLVVSTLAGNGDIPNTVIQVLITLAMFIPNIMIVEGGFLLVIMGLLFYIFKKHRFGPVIILLLFSFVIYLVNPSDIQWLMCMAAIPIIIYNGERGRRIKNFFYIFYPLHIGLLYLLSTFIE